MSGQINNINNTFNPRARLAQILGDRDQTSHQTMSELIASSRERLEAFKAGRPIQNEVIPVTQEPEVAETQNTTPAQDTSPCAKANNTIAQVETKPKKPSDKEKLEAAQKEKEELFKSLNEDKNINAQTALKELRTLESTFVTLNSAFRLKVDKLQVERDSYKPSSHTDINGNNGKGADNEFYAANSNSTRELMSYSKAANSELSAIRDKIHLYQMEYLRG